MRMTGHKRWTAACGVQMFIIGVFGSTAMLAQAPPMPRVQPAPPSAMPAGTAAVDAAVTADPNAVTLLVGRSTLVDVGSAISRVSLTSADIADALVTSPTQLLVHGKVPGSISMFVWNRGGAVKRYEIVVQRDLARLSDQMRQLFPGEAIQVHSNGKQIVLAGTVSRKEVADRAISVAAGYVEKKEDVVTLLAAQPGPASNQVLLRVRFAEVSRSAMTEFGMSYFTSPTGVKNNVGRLSTQQYSAPTFSDLAWTKADGSFGSDVTSASGKLDFSDFLNLFLLNQKYDLGVLIKALQNRGLFQSLAEPNLVAESGKEASFLAGGEFPIPVVQGSANNAAVSVQFKEFGVRLNFTPTVNGDRVHLKVKPEVSTLDYGNAVVLNGFRIPALSTRRPETELELRDGQTFAIAGLMNNQMQSTLQKIPGIGDIPILGHLFRSRAAQKNQTELVVMITPEIIRPDSPGVTRDLPRMPETFLPPIPENKTRPAPAPAFTPQSRSQASDAAAPVVTAERVNPDRSVEQAARSITEREAQAAAAAEQAATAVAAEQAAAKAAEEQAVAKRAQDAWEAAARQAAAEEQAAAAKKPEATGREAATVAASDARPQAAERQRLEKDARAQAERDAKAAEKARQEEARQEAAAKKEMEKLAKEQAKRDAAEAKEQAKRDAAEAKEQAKRDAAAAREQAKADKQSAEEARRQEEDAKRQALEAKRDVEREQDRQRAIDAAADRLRAAEADYQAELARRSER